MEIVKISFLLAGAYCSYRFWKYITNAQAFSNYAYLKIPLRLKINFSCICIIISLTIALMVFLLAGRKSYTYPLTAFITLAVPGLFGIFKAGNDRNRKDHPN